MDRPSPPAHTAPCAVHPSLTGALLRFAIGFCGLVAAAVALAWISTGAGPG